MISKQTIQKVDELPLEEVIGEYVALKKSGSGYTGKSPFADEKTPSFNVSPSKGVYKCFSSGNGGTSGIKFLMDLKKITFPEAVRELCAKFGIVLEETEDTPDQKAQHEKKLSLLAINQLVKDKYVKHLAKLRQEYGNAHPMVSELFLNRQLADETLFIFEVGASPAEWRFIAPTLIDRNSYDEALALGLINTGENGNTYDLFRDRIIFPVHNANGEVIGFGGRILGDGKPKYINSTASGIYKKDSVLYGIYQAKNAIRQMGYAIIVEGYFDVLSLYQNGAQNTVAVCGTAFTDGHAKNLRRYTDKAVIMGDGDGAGKKSVLRTIDILFANGISASVCELPEGQDPDSFVRMQTAGGIL